MQYIADIDLERGGIVRAVLDLSAALAARGHRVVVATANGRDAPAEWTGGSRPSVVTVARRGRRRFTAESVQTLRTLLDEADVVHAHNLWNPELRHLAALARAARRPYVLTPHGTLDPWSMAQRPLKKRAYLAAGGRRLINRADTVHFAAAEEERYARRWVQPSRSAVAPVVLDLAPFAAVARRATTDPPHRLLFLSRLHEKKGLDVLLRAVRVLADEGIAVEVDIAGTGDAAYVERMRRLAGELGLGAIARFLSTVTGDARLDAFGQAEVFVVPTSQENFGIVFAEALAAGVPVVTTRGTDIWRELEDTGGAVVLPPDGDTVSALAAAIRDLLGDPARRAAMSADGRRGILRWLDPDRTVQAYEAMYASATQP